MNVRAINRRQVLETIRLHGPIARYQIAAHTALSQSTISNIARDLIDAGLVQETGPEPTGSVGRDPIGLVLNPQAHSVVGIQVGDDDISGLLLDFSGAIRKKVPKMPVQKSGPMVLADQIARTAAGLLRGAPPVLGIGIAIAGMVDNQAGTIFAPNILATGIPLGHLLEKQLTCPFLIENEVNTMTLAEHSCGAARGKQDVLGIHIGLGIGGSLILNGNLYRGWIGTAGEIGHMVFDVNGPPCGCGNRGCLETLAGGKVMLSAFHCNAETGEMTVAAPDLLKKAANYLGIGLAGIANVFTPELCVLGGSCCHLLDPVFPVFQQAFYTHLLPANRKIAVERGSVENSEAFGAALLILSRFFENPAL